MANYTTPAEVEEILRDAPEAPLDPFITSAHMLVVRACDDKGYEPEELELIERWLSAHLYSASRPQTSSESVDSVSESFRFTVGLGLDNSTYGQMAKTLDYHGGLAELDEDAKNGGATSAHICNIG